jgi:hypothetical protein
MDCHQQAASVSFYLLKGAMHFLPARSIHWEEGLYGSEIVVVLIMTVASRIVIAHLVWFYSFSSSRTSYRLMELCYAYIRPCIYAMMLALLPFLGSLVSRSFA